LLAGPAPLAIDCSGILEVDLAIVQLLAAAHKTAGALGKPLRLIAPDDGPLAALLRQAGFVGADGRPLTPEGPFWINAEGKAA
jgi:anti-anti-sigma regulatory factor